MSHPNAKDIRLNSDLSYTSFVSVATAPRLALANKVQVVGPSGEHTCKIELTSQWIRFMDHSKPDSQLYKYAWQRVKYMVFYKQQLRIKFKAEANNKVAICCQFGVEEDSNRFERMATMYKFVVKLERELSAFDRIRYGSEARFYAYNEEEVGQGLYSHKLPDTDDRPVKLTKVKLFAGGEEDCVSEQARPIEESKDFSKLLFTHEDHDQDHDFLSNNHDMFDFMKRQEFIRSKMQDFCKNLEDKM